ncbi:helix-turn-helix transcriptional regulator [Sinomonas gamaensis]|uniref:helix-turn-helix transcriptional regulator n=1 Tax=Sinomonas gamaensis TaxID=2565624 RepID=UPI001BB20957|nr:helix-turn-helix domain-containing protein [Sinomonas gamaensis]
MTVQIMNEQERKLAHQKLLSLAEVSEMTRIPENTLRYYRQKGEGPRFGKLGGRLVARESDVLAWIDAAFEDKSA